MAWYTQKELEQHRRTGLQLTNEQNENESFELQGNIQEWTNDEFENYLSTKTWDNNIKNSHRRAFNGKIVIADGRISYPD